MSLSPTEGAGRLGDADVPNLINVTDFASSGGQSSARQQQMILMQLDGS